MGIFSRPKRILTSWQFIAAALAGLGLAAGALIFVYVYPGAPRIGVITIPAATVLSADTAYVIGQYLDYARRDGDIKAVVIRLSSPGGGASASELLYLETRKLRDAKPVVAVLNGLVASGGYMMAMGASHTYTQPSSLVGNVGVVSLAGPLITPPPGEEIALSGPHKLDGGSRREWAAMGEQVKESFAQTVVTERGNRLRIAKDELAEGRIYSGMDAVRLGLADGIGGDTDAFRKAAALAGLSGRYRIVDVNLEVLKRNFAAIAPLLTETGAAGQPNPAGPAAAAPSIPADAPPSLRRLLRYGELGAADPDPLPGFPMELDATIGAPTFYYLYVGNER